MLSAVALVVLAGLVKFIFDRAKGNTENLAKNKKNILWGMVALFILVSLWGIIKMFQVIIGIPNDNTIPIPKICVDEIAKTASSTTNKGAGGNAGGVLKNLQKA